MSDERMLPSMDILTPEFKEVLKGIVGKEDDILECRVIPSHKGVTIKQAQDECLRWVKEGMVDNASISNMYPDKSIRMSLDQFLGSQS